VRRRGGRQRRYTRRPVTEFLQIFVRFLVMALWMLILGRVLLSWINPRFEGPVARFLFETTEPLLVPIRKILPKSGQIDFSPLVLMLGLTMLLRIMWFV
jgi:YggT family protein